MADIESVKLPNGNEYNIKDVVSPRGSQPNLLINPWFTVNQRGFTSGTYSTKTYIVDRWCTNRATISLSSSGLTLAKASGTDGWIRQYLENDYAGETITISLIVDNVIYSKSGIGSFNFNVSPSVYVEWDESFKMLHIENTSTTAVTIRAVKLEIGSVSTLHLDTAPDYTTELLKCQRYFLRIASTAANTPIVSAGYSLTSNTYRASIFTPAPMRIKQPSCIIVGNGKLVNASSEVQISSISSVQENAGGNSQPLTFTTSTSGLTTNDQRTLVLYSNGYIDLDAEL